MSAVFIVKYAGAALRFTGRIVLAETEETATQFTSTAEAWLAVHQSKLNPNHCRVVSLEKENA